MRRPWLHDCQVSFNTGNWYVFNDSHVEQVPEDRIVVSEGALHLEIMHSLLLHVAIINVAHRLTFPLFLVFFLVLCSLCALLSQGPGAMQCKVVGHEHEEIMNTCCAILVVGRRWWETPGHFFHHTSTGVPPQPWPISQDQDRGPNLKTRVSTQRYVFNEKLFIVHAVNNQGLVGFL